MSGKLLVSASMRRHAAKAVAGAFLMLRRNAHQRSRRAEAHTAHASASGCKRQQTIKAIRPTKRWNPCLPEDPPANPAIPPREAGQADRLVSGTRRRMPPSGLKRRSKVTRKIRVSGHIM
jgi:hypothetical protein